MVKTFDFFYRFYSLKLLGRTVICAESSHPTTQRKRPLDPKRKILRTKEIGESGHLRVTGKMAKTGQNSVQKCGGMVF